MVLENNIIKHSKEIWDNLYSIHWKSGFNIRYTGFAVDSYLYFFLNKKKNNM